MSVRLPYKRLNRLIENETFEPTLNWGLRMGVASVVPVIWGLATGNLAIAEWITLTAECICWVELRGSSALRLRVLIGGAILALVFAFLGTVTAGSIWLSVGVMLVVAYLSSLFKNLGDRGSGLAICVYVLFIISNAFPVKDTGELLMRCLYILIGGAWNTLVGMAASAFVPEQEPYRRSIAIIWKTISPLTGAVARGLDGKGMRSGLREIYLKEKEVRTAIDNSLHFFDKMAHQVGRHSSEYQLAQTRKATALAATHVIAMSDELEGLNFNEIDGSVRLKLYALFRALQQTMERMAGYVLSLKSEEELLLASRMNRVGKLIGLLRVAAANEPEKNSKAILRVAQLAERSVKIIESCMKRMEQLGTELPIYRSYSLMKTIYVLHPKYLVRNIRLLFNPDSFMTRYALRTAVAAGIALFIFKQFKIDHGYWLPFTVVIVIQPYFVATFQKARDRITGTLLGVITGSLLISTPAVVKVALLFACSVFMVYFLRKRYSVAAFFITVSLVLLFAVEDQLNTALLVTRALSTLAGAALAVVAGFALLPAWDSKWLPRYLSDAIAANYEYFRTTFFGKEKEQNWTRCKRLAETKNSNLFDSFNRYIQEPQAKKKRISLYYQAITHNVRLTREMNNIHLEEEGRGDAAVTEHITAGQTERITRCLDLLNRCALLGYKMNPPEKMDLIPLDRTPTFYAGLTVMQESYLAKMEIELKAMYKELEQLTEELT